MSCFKGDTISSTSKPPNDKTNKMICASSETSDQPGHPPSLIRVFIVRSVGNQGPMLCLCGQWWPWSDWADAQADLSRRWVHRSFWWFCHEAAQINMLIETFCCVTQVDICSKYVTVMLIIMSSYSISLFVYIYFVVVFLCFIFFVIATESFA